MNDKKMSECFDLPVEASIAYVDFSVNAIYIEDTPNLSNEQIEHAEYAINNHDRLTEENKQLRDHLSNLIDESIYLAQFKNDTLRGNIRSTDLDEPEWHDYQTIGEAGAYLESLNK